MRILFLAHRLPFPPNKGDKIRSFWELKTLSKSHEVDLFCFYDDKQDKLEIAKLHSYCRSWHVEPLSVLGSRMRALSALARGRTFSTAFFYSRTMANAVAAAVKSRSYDIAFVFGSAMAQYVEPWPDLPAILDLVDVDSDKWAQYSNRSHGPLSWLWRIESRRLEKCESAFVQAFSNTLICTEAEAQLLRSKVPCEKIAVLQNSLDTDYFQPKTVLVPETIRALQPYAIFTGTMDYFPNIDAVQFFCNQVLPLIRAKVPNLSFVVAGRSPSAEVMRLMAQPGVKITGTLPDIRPYLKGAAVAVAPMRIARGVQNKILEALAMDVPVVASSIAASALPREVAMLLAAESEPTLLAARVAEQVLAPPERSRIRRAGIKQYVEGLDLASQLERLLSDAIDKPTVCVKEDQIEVGV